MKILETDRDPENAIAEAIAPPVPGTDQQVEQAVREIIADVRTRGDVALIELGRKFDAPELSELRVSEAEFEEASEAISQELLNAIRIAKANIEDFHRKQLPQSWIDNKNGIIRGQLVAPIATVGIYAPARLAPLPSSVLMTAIPAVVAGVPRIVLCCPPQKDGKVFGPMLVAARECGVTEIYRAGGAGAAAAMAYGTQTIPKVDKIVGPGNVFFNEAKRQLFGVVGIDQFAGPSEILVIADENSNPAHIAADLISQAEHAPDSRCALVTNSRELAASVLNEVKKQSVTAARKEFIQQSLDELGVVIIAQSIDECVDIANKFAPEHLEIQTMQPWDVAWKIRNAGTIMVGANTPVPLCDFAAGPNHTLPTGGTARFTSPLSVDDFIKKSGLLSVSAEALAGLAPTVIEMAESEGLEGHANTVRIRLD